jgi:ComF family protein
MGGVYAWLTFAREALFSLLSPPRCAACDAPVALHVSFCSPCARSIVACEVAPQSGIRSAYEYGGALARAIAKMKYEDRPDLARPLGHALALCAPPGDAEMIVPVPLHPMRLAERGFNQVSLLARPLARRLARPLDATAVTRTRDTPRQATLGRAERLENVEGAFVASTRVRGKRVLLVDDVCTTGATIRACVSALRRAGASEVAALVLARAR